MKRFLLIITFICFEGKSSGQTITYARPSAKIIINDLLHHNPDNRHPRLYASKYDFIKLRQSVKTDPFLKLCYARIKAQADAALAEPAFKYDLSTDKAPVSRITPARLNALCLAYQIEQDPKYAQRAYLEMTNIAAWPEWGTKASFLNVADMMWAFSIGYDWCYDWMNTDQRKIIRTAIIEHGLNKIVKIYDDNPENEFQEAIGTVQGSNNWNPWCNGGAAVCALAIGDEEPGIAGEVLEKGLRALENWISVYAPDGGSTEGIGYGNHAMALFTRWIAAMQSALGTSYGYFNTPGIAQYAYFPVYMNGPVTSFNFHDSGNNTKQYLDVAFFLADKLRKPSLGYTRKRDIVDGNAPINMFDVIWYKPAYNRPSPQKLSLDKYFRKVETGSFRSSWDDPNAIFLTFHGGQNWVSHTHLDAGQFDIDAMGLNWALDLGTEPLTYIGAPGSFKDRFELYRLKPEGHNTLLINPSQDFGQSIHAWCPVVEFVSKPSGAFAKIDLTDAYRTQVNSAIRGYALIKNRSKIVIQDELDLKKAADVWWFMHTKAKIAVSLDGKSALLTQEGKTMKAILVSPTNGEFIAMAAKPMPGTFKNPNQTPNTGIYKLAAKIPNVQKVTIRIELIPVFKNSDMHTKSEKLVPLSKWKLD